MVERKNSKRVSRVLIKLYVVSISCVIAAPMAGGTVGSDAGYLPYAPVIKFFERTIAECTGRGTQLKGKRFVSWPQRTPVIKRIRPR